jgi:hypothetical protein
MLTQQGTEGARCCYNDKAYVGARVTGKLYVQRALELSYAGRESHTNGARCLAHSAVLSEDLLGSNPNGIAPLRVHKLAAALAHQLTYSSHVRKRKFMGF